MLTGPMRGAIQRMVIVGLWIVSYGTSDAVDRINMDLLQDRMLQPLLEQEVSVGHIEMVLAAFGSDGSCNASDYRDTTRVGL